MARSTTLTDALAEVGFVPCGDNSCMFGSPGGVATNGGCRCLPATSTPEDAHAAKMVARRLARVARWLAAQVDEALAEVATLRAKLAEAKRLGIEACETTDEAIDSPLDADAVGRIGAKSTVIRTALEAL